MSDTEHVQYVACGWCGAPAGQECYEGCDEDWFTPPVFITATKPAK